MMEPWDREADMEYPDGSDGWWNEALIFGMPPDDRRIYEQEIGLTVDENGLTAIENDTSVVYIMPPDRHLRALCLNCWKAHESPGFQGEWTIWHEVTYNVDGWKAQTKAHPQHKIWLWCPVCDQTTPHWAKGVV